MKLKEEVTTLKKKGKRDLASFVHGY